MDSKKRVLSTLSACKHKQTLHSLLLKDTSCWVTAGIQPRGNHLPLLSKIYSCLHLQIFYPLTGIKITKRSSEFSRDQSSQPSMPEDKASLIYDLWNPGAPQNPLSQATHTLFHDPIQWLAEDLSTSQKACWALSSPRAQEGPGNHTA